MVAVPACRGQFIFEPEGAHADLYFPHLADGGDQSFKFQTAITLLNPSTLSTANVTLSFYGDDGQPLPLNFGAGSLSTVTLTIPPAGTSILRSTAASPTLISGWALGISDIPLQGTVQFRAIINGTPQQEISALATSPAVSYVSPASALTGLALANVYSGQQSLTVTVLDAVGVNRGTTTVNLPSFGHRAFNLNTLFPSLAPTFSGSVKVTPVNRVSAPYFLGWTLSVDSSGVLSSYPPGNQAWPVNHIDRIRDVYMKTLNAAQYWSKALGLGVPFTPTGVPLKILSNQTLNAFATRTDSSISIEIALSELISDSPSELAFAVAHEMGHIIQFKTGKLNLVSTNQEYDADQWGMLITLLAGYDPYAAAGTLSKLAMASNDASLVSQQFDNINGDVHGSFNNRVALVYSAIQALCSTAEVGSFCSDYKLAFHPHFPGKTPLFRSGEFQLIQPSPNR